jgi:hypothetical protein
MKMMTHLWKTFGRCLPKPLTNWYGKYIKMPMLLRRGIIVRTTDKEEFMQKVNLITHERNIACIGQNYWAKQKKWQSPENTSLQYGGYDQKRFLQTKELIEQYFAPCLKQDFVAADLACAAGDITLP